MLALVSAKDLKHAGFSINMEGWGVGMQKVDDNSQAISLHKGNTVLCQHGDITEQ